MKKVLVMLLAVVMIFSFTACGKTTEPNSSTGAVSGNSVDNAKTGSDDSANSSSLDLSKYPADFNDWTAQNLADYFFEAVDFPSDCEIWVQEHAEYFANMPLYECSGIWNADGADDVCAVFFTFKPDNPDTKPEEVEAIKKIIREDKNHDYTTEDLLLGPQDHMIGNVSFSYGITTPNEEVYNAIEEAYNDLVQAMGLTPDF